MNAREKEIKLGWTIVTAILGFILLLGLVGLGLRMASGAGLGLGNILGFVLSAGLCWMVYQGRGWARFVLVVLMLLSTIMTLLSGAALLRVSQLGGIGAFFLVIGLLYLASAISLFAVPAVNRYFEYVNS